MNRLWLTLLAVVIGTGEKVSAATEDSATRPGATRVLMAEGKSLPAWIAALKSDEPGVRLRAAGVLGKFGPAARLAIPGLVAASEDLDHAVRVEAVLAICRIGGPEVKPLVRRLLLAQDSKVASPSEILARVRNLVVPELIELLDDGEAQLAALRQLQAGGSRVAAVLAERLHDRDAATRAGMARALALFGDQAKEALPALAAALDDPKLTVRHSAARALWLLDRRTQGTVAVFVQSLEQSDPTLRLEALECLNGMGPDARPAQAALIKALADERLVYSAAATLAGIGPETVPVLVTALDKRQPACRQAAAAALAQLGPKAREAVPALLAALEERDNGYRVAVAAALAEIDPVAHRRALPALLEALGDGNTGVVLGATQQLRLLGSTARPAVPALLETIKSPECQLRLGAASALATIDRPAAAKAVPYLMETLHDRRSHIRERACIILGEIGPAARPAAGGIVQALREQLKEEEYDQEEDPLVTALVRVGATNEAVSVLIETLNHESPWQRRYAADLLAKLGKEALLAVPELQKARQDEDAGVRKAALRTLEKLAGPDLPAQESNKKD